MPDGEFDIYDHTEEGPSSPPGHRSIFPERLILPATLRRLMPTHCELVTCCTAARVRPTKSSPTAQLQLGAEPGLAQKPEVGVHAGRALTHSPQPVMPLSGVSRGECLRIDAAAIVADSQPQRTLSVGDLRRDFMGLCMPERVGKGFVPDAEELLAHRWIHGTRIPLDDEPEPHRIDHGQFPAGGQHEVPQLGRSIRGSSQLGARIPAFDQQTIGSLVV